MTQCAHGFLHCPECSVEVGVSKPNIANALFTMDIYLHATTHYLSLEGDDCDYDSHTLMALFDKARLFALAVRLFEV